MGKGKGWDSVECMLIGGERDRLIIIEDIHSWLRVL